MTLHAAPRPASAARRAIGVAGRGLQVGGTSWMVVGSLIAGVGAYAFQVVAARGLGEVGYAPISVLWTIQYLLLAVVLYSMESYVTRAVVLGADDPARVRRAVAVLGAWVAALAVVLSGLTYLAREALFGGAGVLSLAVGAIVIGYGAFVVVRGALAGRSRFKSYGAATALESVVRLAVAVAALLWIGTTGAVAWSLPAGAVGAAGWWLVARRAQGSRPAALDSLPLGSGRPTRFLLLTTVANGAAQALLAAGPLILVPLGATPAAISVFFVTVTAARAPLVVVQGGVLSRVLPTFTRMAARGDTASLGRVAVWLAAATALLAGVGAAAAAVAGPTVVALLFGDAFRPQWWLVAGAIGGVVLATGGMLLNQMLIAEGREERLVAPWLLALAVAAGTLLVVAGDPLLRVTAGFVAGETVALGALVVTIARTRRTTPQRRGNVPQMT